MQHHKVKTSRTAHYYSLGSANNQCKEVWIVCHGYGQNAEDFLVNFEPVDNGERWIIAPEGLSRFYWGGFTGPIASSWMTSKNRLDEINDYCDWLDQIYQFVRSSIGTTVKVTLFGFSQGTATIMRWIHARQPDFDRLVLWAGMTPEDIDYDHLKNHWPQKNCWLLYGTNDQFIDDGKINWQIQFAEQQHLPLQFIPFDGKHRVNAEALLKLVND